MIANTKETKANGSANEPGPWRIFWPSDTRTFSVENVSAASAPRPRRKNNKNNAGIKSNSQ
jgi:hypothetical protein